jgi:hypothetical protein
MKNAKVILPTPNTLLRQGLGTSRLPSEAANIITKMIGSYKFGDSKQNK